MKYVKMQHAEHGEADVVDESVEIWEEEGWSRVSDESLTQNQVENAPATASPVDSTNPQVTGPADPAVSTAKVPAQTAPAQVPAQPAPAARPAG